MTGKKRNRARNDSRLEEIKQAAVKLFFRQGYAATDLRQIAEEVGLHVSSFYNYIQGKEELLYLIVLEGTQLSVQALDQALEGVTDPVERLRRAIRAHVLFQAEMRYISWTSLTELRLLTGKYAADIHRRIDEYEATWVRLVEAAIASGQLRPVDTRVAVYGMLTMAQGVARWFNPRGRVKADAVADLYADILLRGLLADRAADCSPTAHRSELGELSDSPIP
jgi:AcrR family transcriptional regulator